MLNLRFSLSVGTQILYCLPLKSLIINCPLFFCAQRSNNFVFRVQSYSIYHYGRNKSANEKLIKHSTIVQHNDIRTTSPSPNMVYIIITCPYAIATETIVSVIIKTNKKLIICVYSYESHSDTREAHIISFSSEIILSYMARVLSLWNNFLFALRFTLDTPEV